VILLCFSTVDKQSYERAKQATKTIRTTPALKRKNAILVATKTDERDEFLQGHTSSYLIVTTAKAQQYAGLLKMPYCEVCATPDEKEGVQELAIKIVEKYVNSLIEEPSTVTSPRNVTSPTSPPNSMGGFK